MVSSPESSDSSDSEGEKIPPLLERSSDYLAYLQSRIQPLTQLAAQLPGPSDLSFHRSLDRNLYRDLDVAKDDIVSTINALLNSTSSKNANLPTRKAGREGSWKLQASDLIDESSFSRNLEDVIDTLLEKAGMALDEAEGRISVKIEKPVRQTERPSSIPAVGPLPQHLLNANIQPLPQLKFSKKPDNSRDVVWKHNLDLKPHAKVPLTWTVPPPGPDEAPHKAGIRQGMYSTEGDPRENPYYYEIYHYQPPAFVSDIPKTEELIQPPPLLKDEPTSGPIPFLWVDDEITFQELYDHLNEDNVKEVAIDVEHHNYRSFQGLVCLVQISTRWHDFIIDALNPQIRNISGRLNDIFANPEKVKILHGAEHDILWLQRDLNLYIVGLFDTYHATNILSFPQHSLAFLLSRYIQFEADKRYQLADWRIRPLEKEMVFYARSDTHSLIHIYDCLRFEITKRENADAVKKVFELSKRTACKTYAKEEWDDGGDTREGWKTVWKRIGGEEASGVDERWQQEGVKGLRRTERIFRALHDWRDQIARVEDESSRYILPSSILLNLSSRAPSTAEEVIPCVGPAFKKRSRDLARLIEREKQSFEQNQREKADHEKALLDGTMNSTLEEEVGEVITRDSTVAPSLWPASTSSDASEMKNNGRSAIASFLFGNTSEANHVKVVPTRPSSLFSPLPESTLKSAARRNVEAGMSNALQSILGKAKQEVQSLHSEAIVEPENVAFVAKEFRAPVTEINMVTSRQEEVSPVSADVAGDDTIVKVKKSKKDNEKKRAEKEEHNAMPKKKKAKWTKEEKEARKKEKEDKKEDIVPFDYSKAKSILDMKVDPTSSTSPHKNKKDKKGKKDKPKQNEKNGTKLIARRDRKEQDGGKSMSFPN